MNKDKLERSNILHNWVQLHLCNLDNVDRKFSEKYPNESLTMVRSEYLRYFALIGSGIKGSPPPILDNYWHEHILHTKDYASDCERVFGLFVHHNPNEGTKVARNKDGKLFWILLQKYMDIWGKPNKKIWDVKRRKKK